MFSHRYRMFFAIALALYAYLNTVLCNVYGYFDMDVKWYHALLTIFLITFFTWEGNRLIERFLKRKIYNPRKKIQYLLLFFLAGNVIAFLSAASVVYMIASFVYHYNWQQSVNPYKLNIIYASLINLFFHLLNAIFFFFKEYRNQWLKTEELRKAQTQAEIQAIKNQVNPHFLFNNLNVLSGMVIKDNPEANRFIEEFSKVYRYILKNQDKELVTLKDELQFVQPYLHLLKTRFPDSLRVNIDVKPSYYSGYVIPAVLQMLIENAIKHNIVSASNPLHIDIHSNGNQTLVVKNNLQPRINTEPSTRIGLQNIQRRYELISGRNVIIDQNEEEFVVTIPVIELN